MELNQYQRKAKRTAIYPRDKAYAYLALGIAGEAGEFANKIKKYIRDGNLDMTGLQDELGDLLWYIALFADESGTTLEAVAQRNLDKLEDRMRRGTLQGSGDTR